MWEKHGIAMRGKFGLEYSYRPWTTLHQLPLAISQIPRLMECLDIGFAIHLKKLQASALRKRNPVPYRPETAHLGLFTHCDQAVQRTPTGSLGVVTTKSVIYSHEHNLVLPGTSHALLQGYPTDIPWAAVGGDAAARSLMGKSYCLPSAATAVTAALLTKGAPWWQHP